MTYDPLILDAGILRHTVTISMPSPAGDAFGATSNVFVPVLTTRVSLQQITAKSMYQAGSLSTQVTHKLRMRYRPDITIDPSCRVTYLTKTYRVVNVDNILERNRVMELLLLELDGKS